MFSVEGNKVFPVARITENEILERQIEQLQATFFIVPENKNFPCNHFHE